MVVEEKDELPVKEEYEADQNLRGQSPNCQFTCRKRCFLAKPIRLFKVFSLQLETPTNLRCTCEPRCYVLGL